MITLVYVVRSLVDDTLEPQRYETRKDATTAANALERWGMADVVLELRYSHAWNDFSGPPVRVVPRDVTSTSSRYVGYYSERGAA